MEETVNCMDTNPFSGFGLRPVELTDRATLCAHLARLSEPLSDHTFSQLFTWSRCLRTFWTTLDGHLCVFANGTGDLTMLLPPIGDGNSDKALASAYEIMDGYNAAHGVPDHSRVEYASDEMLRHFDAGKLDVAPLAIDYVYDVNRMIDLAGGDLASKRQAKNRFMRNYAYHVEPYDAAKHLEPCRQLLAGWKQYQDHQHFTDGGTNATKRAKESIACDMALQHAGALGLRGLVVHVNETGSTGERDLSGDGWAIRGFTFGETLGADQASIVIEKTDLTVKGLAQFIFSEFCRTVWAHRPRINVGDDWGLESLAWTKMSYRPIQLLQKSTFRRKAAIQMAVPAMPSPLPMAPMEISTEAGIVAPTDGVLASASMPTEAKVRRADKADLSAAVALETGCFSSYCLTKRQLQYLQQRQSAVFLVAEDAGRIVGEGISLVRRHKRGASGRIYSLAVDPIARGRRIGQRILRAMIDDLAARGAKRIYLEVEATNTAAIALYHRNGFTQVGRLVDYYGPGRDGLHMRHDVPTGPTLFEPSLAIAS